MMLWDQNSAWSRTSELSHAGPMTQANPELSGKPKALPGVGSSDLRYCGHLASSLRVHSIFPAAESIWPENQVPLVGGKTPNVISPGRDTKPTQWGGISSLSSRTACFHCMTTSNTSSISGGGSNTATEISPCASMISVGRRGGTQEKLHPASMMP